MARKQPPLAVRRSGRQSSAQKPSKNPAVRPRGIQRKQALKSTNLLEQPELKNQIRLPKSPVSNVLSGESKQDLEAPLGSLDADRKRKHTEEPKSLYDKNGQKQKRRRKSSVRQSTEAIADGRALGSADSIDYWRKKHNWPSGYLKSEMSSQPLRKRSASNRSQDQKSSLAESSSAVRSSKDTTYKETSYEEHLTRLKIFMGGTPDGIPAKINEKSKKLCKDLLDSKQPIPVDSIFHGNRLDILCEMIQFDNERRLIMDVTRLLVPSPQTLVLYGDTKLKILKERADTAWLDCIPITKARPQPDFCVGFGTFAFTDNELDVLDSYIVENKEPSSVKVRQGMYFPFLTCEVKCGDEGLNAAELQNMHSASISVKGIVELFRAVHRQKELHQSILAFSVSHNSETVKIYGHYSLIHEGKTSFHRHLIKKFTISGDDRWTCYQFTRNVYDKFVPRHLTRIRSAIKDLSKADNSGVQRSGTSPIPQGQGCESSSSKGASVISDDLYSDQGSGDEQMGPPPPKRRG